MVEAASRNGHRRRRHPQHSPAPITRWSKLERELADLHGKKASLVFTSGYVSNQTGIPTIAKLLPNCLLLSDALNHNSMIEGVRQSGAEKQIWRHNDTGHLEELLKAADPKRPKLILFESLYSMDGDIAPVHAICDLAGRYGRHDLRRRGCMPSACYGPRGGGNLRARRRDGPHRPSSRARWPRPSAALGGYIAGSEEMVDAVRSYAPGFIFTTALPPAICRRGDRRHQASQDFGLGGASAIRTAPRASRPCSTPRAFP